MPRKAVTNQILNASYRILFNLSHTFDWASLLILCDIL